ncbi:aldehyde dehydrogenase (NADP(+)) [Tsukamurella tyrosinosolvens]|uniref:aldehyde dehydrogenase (NADP(+)) n=1 Tax=Tsukamurella tyrosinosolvens TaxID=57704 RepID=UPI003F4A0FFD
MVIGGAIISGSGPVQHSVDPRTGERLGPGYGAASPDESSAACAAAAGAATAYRNTPPHERARFLEVIAEEIDARAEALIARATRETALPNPRISGEVSRTSNQLRLFAAELREGSYEQLRVDPAQRDRMPQPRSDIRQRRIPVGPVAVFGASNFPLAFSTAGGDTASALAAGCPVVVKAHPAHLGTAEIVGRAIAAAARATGMPDGVFSQVVGAGNESGARLVADPRIRAVGFTGSRGGGLALQRIAQERDIPIPVYAEMSSINPVIVLPGALAERAGQLGRDYAASLTLGAGQFCTNPGIILGIDSAELNVLTDAATDAITEDAGGTMLSTSIADTYRRGVQRLRDHGARELAAGAAPDTAAGASAHLFTVGASEFVAQPALRDEVFGAASIVVRCSGIAELTSVLSALEGQLTATIHAAPADGADVAALLPVLEDLAGRIIVNGWPTGVEVGHAMVHGGPFPATTDGRSTSVGSAAIERFLRPVAYQDIPPELLPRELAHAETVTAPLRLDGRMVVPEPEQEGL